MRKKGVGFPTQDAGFPIPASAFRGAAARHPLRQFLEPFTTRNIQAVFGAEVERGPTMRGQVAMIGNMGFFLGLTVWNLHLGSSLCNLYHLMRCLCRIPPQQVERTKQTAQKTVHPRIFESNTSPKINILIHSEPKNEGLEDDVSLQRVNFQVPC